MKVKVIFIVVFIAGVLFGSIPAVRITSNLKNKEFSRTEEVYNRIIDKQSASYDSLANKARYLIQQTLTIKKNKKGQTIFVPSSTMEIQRIIENYKLPIDTLKIPEK